MPPEAIAGRLQGARPQIAETRGRRLIAVIVNVASFPAMVASMLAAAAVFVVRNRFADPDAWWHLKLGQLIWQTGQIPRADSFSYTAAGHPWIAHEWLAELSMWWAWQAGGMSGLMGWLCVWAIGLALLLYALCCVYGEDAAAAVPGALWGFCLATVGLATRPLLIGHVLLVVELFVIQLARTRSRYWLLALPPLFALWINCHGSYYLGFVVLGIYGVCSLVEIDMGGLRSGRWPAPARRMLWPAAGLSLAALFLNPLGWDLIVYPLDLFANQKDNLALVAEWRPLDIGDPRALALFAVASVVFLLALTSKVKLRLDELLLFGLGLAMSVRYQRMLFACGILAAPILTRVLAELTGPHRRERRNPALHACVIFMSIVLAGAALPTPEYLARQVEHRSPVGAVEFIKKASLSGPLLNEYEFGGYLLWALPEEKVFIDGRADLYDWSGIFRQMARWALLQEDPALLPDRYGARLCLLRTGGPMTFVMKRLSGWTQVYSDETATVFARR